MIAFANSVRQIRRNLVAVGAVTGHDNPPSAGQPPVGSAAWWEAQSRRREPLTTDRIVAAAIRLVETEGGNALSMRRLAAHLGVAPASLYRHVESREALVLLAGEAILAAVELPDDPEAPWPQRTANFAYAVRRALGRHRGRATFVLGPDSPAPQAFTIFHRGLQVYLDAGFPPDLAQGAVQAVAYLVRSFAALESEGADSLVVPPRSLVPPGEDRLAEARLIDGPGSERPTDELFDFLLEGVIDGIARRAADEGVAPATG
jgi:AcrR family transcriptional regulator